MVTDGQSDPEPHAGTGAHRAVAHQRPRADVAVEHRAGPGGHARLRFAPDVFRDVAGRRGYGRPLLVEQRSHRGSRGWIRSRSSGSKTMRLRPSSPAPRRSSRPPRAAPTRSTVRLFETNRNSGYGVARARQDASRKAPFLNRNEFGFSAGGPVYIPKLYNGKNKTFWFTSWEWSRQVSALTLQASLPTAEMRNGNLAGLDGRLGQPHYHLRPLDHRHHHLGPPAFPEQPVAAEQAEPALEVPARGHADADRDGHQPVLRHRTTSARGPRSTASGPAPTASTTDSAKRTRSTAATRRADTGPEASSTACPRWTGTRCPATPRATISPNWSFALSHVHTFSPTFFNELLVTGTRTKHGRRSRAIPRPVTTAHLGFPTRSTATSGRACTISAFNGSYQFETQNGTGFYAFYGILDDNATKIVGKHELQFGFHFRPDQMNLLPQQQQTGGSNQLGLHGHVALRPQHPAHQSRHDSLHRRPVRQFLPGHRQVQQPVEPRHVLCPVEGVRGVLPGQLARISAPDPEPGVALRPVPAVLREEQRGGQFRSLGQVGGSGRAPGKAVSTWATPSRPS